MCGGGSVTPTIKSQREQGRVEGSVASLPRQNVRSAPGFLRLDTGLVGRGLSLLVTGGPSPENTAEILQGGWSRGGYGCC